MTNDERRNNVEARMTKFFSAVFVIRSSESSFVGFVIRASSFSGHLPVFHELIWDFLEKTRGPLEDVAIPPA